MCEGYNYEKITNSKNIIGEATEIIQQNITPLHDSVVFIGGEPTIWGDQLENALKFCHEKGLKTKIFSNGVNSEVIERINNQKLCDAWSIDFKGLHNIQQEFGISAQEYLPKVEYSIIDIAERKLPLEIRTTFYNGNTQWRECIRKHVEFSFIKKYPYIKYIEQEDVRSMI
jgi:pyruvate-formate lyase-activating enzyme